MLNSLKHSKDTPGSFALVREPTRLQDMSRVEQHLPEILGRALARGWIDPNFSQAMLSNPKGLLRDYGVFLPSNVALDVERQKGQRPRIVVSEILAGNEVRRLMYFQLVMVAGR